MRVLHLINNLRREGAQTVILNLVICRNVKEQVDHSICVRQPGGPLQPLLEQHSIPVFTPERYFGIFSIRRTLGFIDQLIENEGFDIIHAHLADAAILGWYIARKRSLPLIITHHGTSLLPDCGAICRNVFRLGLKTAAHYAFRNIAVSSSVAEQLRLVLNLAPKKVTTISNGVPVPAEIHIKQRYSHVEPAPYIVNVGRLVSIKGHDQLISAASAIVDKYDKARFIVVGEGPLANELNHKIESSGLSEHVILAGPSDDVPSYLRAADIYVSTSHYEGMPLSVLEAMAWCVPIIASDVPGNNDVVQHNISGLLYQLGDTKALADAICNIIDSPVSACKRALHARRLVQKNYSSEITANAYGALYTEALGSDNSR